MKRGLRLCVLLAIAAVVGACSNSGETTVSPEENQKMKDAFTGKNARAMTDEEKKGMEASMRGIGQPGAKPPIPTR